MSETTISIAISEPSDVVTVSSAQYNLSNSEWWITTQELVQLPNSRRRVIVMGRGHAPVLEDALRAAGTNHVQARERRYQEDK